MRQNARKAIAAFHAGSRYLNDSIWTDGVTIFSYGTAIFTHDDELGFVLNDSHYSRTTTSHQSAIRCEHGDVLEVSDLPRGCTRDALLAAARVKRNVALAPFVVRTQEEFPPMKTTKSVPMARRAAFNALSEHSTHAMLAPEFAEKILAAFGMPSRMMTYRANTGDPKGLHTASGKRNEQVRGYACFDLWQDIASHVASLLGKPDDDRPWNRMLGRGFAARAAREYIDAVLTANEP